MRRMGRAVGTALVWAAIQGAVAVLFGRSAEAVAMGMGCTFLFGTAGLLIGRSWVP